VLEKYRILPSLKAVIEKMYKNCQVEIKCGKISAAFDYTTGVYQGDDMLPIFFLFIMQEGKNFNFRNALYVDDSMFLFNTWNELKETASRLQKHFACFGLIMHIGNLTTKSKSEAMYFPPLLAEAKKLEEEGYLPEDIKLPHDNERISFSSNFKYLGSIITPLLKEDTKIAA
jgi:hypothetical protein